MQQCGDLCDNLGNPCEPSYLSCVQSWTSTGTLPSDCACNVSGTIATILDVYFQNRSSTPLQLNQKILQINEGSRSADAVWVVEPMMLVAPQQAFFARGWTSLEAIVCSKTTYFHMLLSYTMAGQSQDLITLELIRTRPASGGLPSLCQHPFGPVQIKQGGAAPSTTQAVDVSTVTVIFRTGPSGCSDTNPCPPGQQCVSGICHPIGVNCPVVPCGPGSTCFFLTETCIPIGPTGITGITGPTGDTGILGLTTTEIIFIVGGIVLFLVILVLIAWWVSRRKSSS